MSNPLCKFGFKKRKSDFRLDRSDISIWFRKHGKRGFDVFAKTDDHDFKVTYNNVVDKEKMMDDISAIIKDKLGIDITASEPTPETAPEPTPEVITIEPDVALRDVSFEQPEVIHMESPTDEEYEPLLMAMDELNYMPIGIEENYESPDIEAELIAKTQEREFQPLNAYPDFPFGDKDSRFMKNGDAEEDVEVSLLDDVRTKEGKYIVEKEQSRELYQTPKWTAGRIHPLVIIVGAALIAYVLFFRNRIY